MDFHNYTQNYKNSEKLSIEQENFTESAIIPQTFTDQYNSSSYEDLDLLTQTNLKKDKRKDKNSEKIMESK